MDMEDLLGIGLGFVTIAGTLLVVGLAFWYRFKNKESRLQKQGEFYSQLLDKFGSGDEFSEFLKQPEGQDLLRRGFTEPDGNSALIKWGIVLTFLGLGCLVLIIWDSSMIHAGIAFLAVGLGCLVAALVSRRITARDS
jgi:hypothetical protein